jgi:hypothetical protein
MKKLRNRACGRLVGRLTSAAFSKVNSCRTLFFLLVLMLVIVIVPGCTAADPAAANQVAYRQYDWSKGDTGNSQFRVFRFHDSPPGLWQDDTGQTWRKVGNDWVKPNG